MGLFSKNNPYKKSNINTVILWVLFGIYTVLFGLVLAGVEMNPILLGCGFVAYVGSVLLTAFANRWFREKEEYKRAFEKVEEELRKQSK